MSHSSKIGRRLQRPLAGRPAGRAAGLGEVGAVGEGGFEEIFPIGFGGLAHYSVFFGQVGVRVGARGEQGLEFGELVVFHGVEQGLPVGHVHGVSGRYLQEYLNNIRAAPLWVSRPLSTPAGRR